MVARDAWVDHYTALLRTVRKPDRSQYEALQAMVRSCVCGVDAWETFAANGVIPMAWLADEQRWFAARRSPLRRAQSRFGATVTTRLATVNAGTKMTATCVPTDKSQAIALAASASSLLAAEALAREVVARSSSIYLDASSGVARNRRVLWGFWRRERRTSLSSRTAAWLRLFGRFWSFSKASQGRIEGLPAEVVARICDLYPTMTSGLPHRALTASLVASGVPPFDADSVTNWSAVAQLWGEILAILRPFAAGLDAVRWTVVYDGAVPRSVPTSIANEQLVDPMEPLVSLWSLGFTLLSEGDDWVYLGVPR